MFRFPPMVIPPRFMKRFFTNICTRSLTTISNAAKFPSWFNEGLAEYYATFEMENDQKALLGGLQHSHLQFLAQQKMMPLETLFNADYQAMHKTGGRQRQVYYAQAWALVHYLMQGNKNRTPQMNQFIELLMNGKDTRTAFSDCFSGQIIRRSKTN